MAASTHSARKSHIKRLYRSSIDKRISGVCGGLGDYLEVDPTPIRLLWVIITILTGVVPGLVAYLIAAMIIPTEPAT